MGAGVIPYCRHDNQALFLFHRTFSGRREGFLVDFGGGGRSGESYRQTAVREFIEETETQYFSEHPDTARRDEESVLRQTPLVEQLFENTLARHPGSWCRRAPGEKSPPKDWVSFFIEIPYRDLEPMNRAWELDDGSRFKKRRELFWVPGEELLALYARTPERLWKRVRQLQGAPELIQAIIGSTPYPLKSAPP
jgi:8-oxo-dGTP pyrophosphatase MutT (NUDIX family)